MHFSVRIYFSRIVFSDRALIRERGPLILASNHPNSFLDAILLGALFKQPVHYVVRGDVFKKPLVRSIFTALKMIPIYRMSEGRENLSLNDETFEKCRSILARNGIILIFSEGLCVHEWRMRPLKKGTARLFLQSAKDNPNGSELRVLPVGLNYHDFSGMGKPVYISFGEMILPKSFDLREHPPANVIQFNKILETNLQKVVLDKTSVREFRGSDFWKKAVCFIPGTLGILLLFPVFVFSERLARKLNKGGVFYDSMLFGFLMILTPIYTFLMTLFVYIISGCTYMWLMMLLMPILALTATRIIIPRSNETVI